MPSVTRILAVSDERDPALEEPSVRREIGPLDAVVGCGDLDPDYLAMLGDAFLCPLVFVRGNHDRGLGWGEGSVVLPETMADGRPIKVGGALMIGLSWPGEQHGPARRDDFAAWRQSFGAAARLAARTLRRGRVGATGASDDPLIIVSHVPPEGAGDVPDDPYHRGFRSYRWLAASLQPQLWLHGHSQVAACRTLVDRLGPTTVMNVTGAALIELA